MEYPADIFARVGAFAGQELEVSELSGGLTNRNYKVTTPAASYVARVSETQSDLLSINRDHEYQNSLLAAKTGVGAPVIEYLPHDGVLILGFLSGRTYTNAAFKEPDAIARVARSVRQLHDGPRFVNDFDMFEILSGYRETVRRNGFRLPAGYDDLMPRFTAMWKVLAATSTGTVPCNNDLLAGNFIDDGQKIWLIDYEYSGNNDPCFELGNIAAECGLDSDQLIELVTAYYGTPRRNKVARARLLSVASTYGWTLWGAIQAGSSSLDFDFWAWTMERFEAGAEVLTSRRLDDLLDEVQRQD